MQHDLLISESFGPNAEAYFKSPVHATGEDLEILRQTIAATDNPNVLDLGCGAGHASFAVASVARQVVAYDLTQAMLDVVANQARNRGMENIRTYKGSVDDLPFPDASFDWVISRYSAHHWRDVEKAMREVRRVSKPHGQVCFIDVVAGPPLFDTHLQAFEVLRDPSHVRDYTAKEWIAFFRNAAFESEVKHQWQLSIDFASWVARVRTSEDRIAALHTLWAGAPKEVRDYFKLKGDFSFELEAAMIVARASENRASPGTNH